jgi:ABC-2 type transport system permease protein
MNKTLLIIKHEFIISVKRVGFIVLTLALPVLALLGIGIIRIVSGVAAPPAEINKIGYVDEAGGFDRFTEQGNISLVPYETSAAALQSLVDKNIREYFIIPPDFLSSGIINRFTTEKEITPAESTIAVVKTFITRNLLAAKVSASEIKLIESPLNLITTILTPSGEVAPEQGGFANLLVPGVFGLLLALSLSFSSAYVIQGPARKKRIALWRFYYPP